MKKFILTFVALVCALVSAMADMKPDGIAYQAVLRDADGKVVVSKEVDVVVKIVYGGSETSLYTEKHSAVMTDEFGLLSLTIGKGTKTGGLSSPYEDLIWGRTRYSVIVEVDIDRDGTADITSKDTFGDVPYSYYSLRSQDFQSSAAKLLTDKEVAYVQNAANDNPSTKVTVSISNKVSKPDGWWVEILGKKINAENPTATFSVPAYSPVFMSWNPFKNTNYYAEITLNGEKLDAYTTEETKERDVAVYYEVKASDYALVATQVTYRGATRYSSLPASTIEANYSKNPTKIKKYSAIPDKYKYAGVYDVLMMFTHPEGTDVNTSDSYFLVESTEKEPYQETVVKSIGSRSFIDGKNFIVGPFVPGKENEIEITYRETVY